MENKQTENPLSQNDNNKSISGISPQPVLQSHFSPQQLPQNVTQYQSREEGTVEKDNFIVGQPYLSQNDSRSTNLKPPRRKLPIWLSLGLLVVFIIAGIVATVMVVYMHNGTGQESSSSDDTPNQHASSFLKTYTKSTSENNMAIPFNATSNGFYAIDFRGEGIGKELSLDGNALSNDSISVSHYYRTQFADGSVTFENLWGFSNVVVKTGNSKIPTSGSFQDYEIVANDQNCYLIRSIWHESKEEDYSIFIGNVEQDYFFKITSADAHSLEGANRLYQEILENVAIGYIGFDENDDFLESTQSIDTPTPINVSDWRFLPDMIMQYYASKGLTYVDSIHTEAFNYYNRFETTIYLPYVANNKTKLERVTINLMDEDNYNKLVEKYKEGSSDKELVNLDAFGDAYLSATVNTAHFNVKTRGGYYNITTELPYYKDNSNAEEQKTSAINFMNHVFLK